MQIRIDRPHKEDIKSIEDLFNTVIVDTFTKNGIPEAYDGEIQYLVRRNTANVEEDLKSSGSQEHFLVARAEHKIVGIMGFGKPSAEIQKNYAIRFPTIPEIKNAFILPDFQRKGIGTKLFENIKAILRERGIKEFVLDSGFASAQVYWKKKLGEPVVQVKNYWNDGTDYLIWHTKI